MPVMKTKMFEADILKPKAIPDGTSLEEMVNVYLATQDMKNVLDVQIRSEISSKYGTNERHFASVLYKE